MSVESVPADLVRALGERSGAKQLADKATSRVVDGEGDARVRVEREGDRREGSFVKGRVEGYGKAEKSS